MANLTYISPFFIVSDVKDSVSFYVNKLGFEVRYIGPKAILFMPWWAANIFLLC